MVLKFFPRLFALVLTGVLVCAASAFAQGEEGQSTQPEPVRRPYRGLFGAESENPNRTESLDLTASVFGGYDDNLTADATGGTAIDSRFQVSGYRVGMGANLSYSKQWERASFSAMGGSAFGYYPDVEDSFEVRDSFIGSYSGGLGFSAPLGERTTLRASQTAGYSPAYTLGVFPLLPGDIGDVQVPSPGLEQAIYTREGYTFSTNAELSRDLSSRSALAVFYDRRTSDFRQQSYDLRDQRMGFRVTQRVRKDLGVRLGYAYRAGQYNFQAAGEPVRTHEIDVGIDYNRTFSFSRRTTLTFGTGSAIVVASDPEQGSSTGYVSGTHYRLLANATLNHEMGRSWNARLAYYRGVQYVAGFTQPLLSDSVTADVSGLISRRVEANVITSYSNGAAGFGAADNGYATYAGAAGLRVAITESLAAFAQYIFQHYDFADGVALPPGFAPRLDRQGARVGLSVSVPLIR